MRCRLLPGLLLLIAHPAVAREDRQLWLNAIASGPIAGPVDASVDVVQRHGDAADGRYQQVFTGMVGYHVTKDVQVWAGYVDARNYTDGRRTVHEHRLRQDVRATVAQPLGGTLALRLRAEERWRDGQPDTGWRLRVQGRFTRPMLGRTALFVSHESFVNLDTTGWGQRAGWERMRNAVGLQVPVTTAVRIEAGYLNQYLRQPGEDEDAHVATLGLALSW